MLKNIYERPLEDINSKGFIYAHECGAKIAIIENDDENRVFSVTIKTMPQNDKGLCHITEHCVLCGSEKYRVKDPFNELDKGSIHTYLNAVTFADKTMYPIASTNEKDFENLMRVYLDAVFFPLIYENEAVYLQEGFHIGENGANGIVYNEMKGVFSQPDSLLEYKIRQKLFEGTPYEFDSGGVPQEIAKTKYEDLTQFHRENYHPSNAILYLYGKVDKEKYFKIFEEYLSRFEYIENNTKNHERKKKEEKSFINGEYYTSDTHEANYIGCAYVLGKAYDYEDMVCADILSDMLFNNESSPIREMLIKEGICNDVYAYVDTDMYEPVMMILAEHSGEKDVKRFMRIIENTVRECIENGFDEKLKKGCINSYEFYMLEEDFGYKPKGLYYNIMLMQNMRYGIMNFDVLDIKKTIEKIKITDYEKAAEKYILKNQQCCCGILKASNKEKEEADFSEYERNDGKLKEYEEKKDGKRELESIPIINIREDIDENKIFSVKNITEIKNGVEIIYNEIKESDIVYINILADTSVLPFEMKRYLDIYRYVLAKIDSKNYGYIDLSNEIAAKTGDLEIYFNIYDDEKNIFPFMITSVKALNENIEDAVMLAEEVLYSSIFDDRERIRNLAKELLSKKEDGMIASGNIFALMRSRAYFDKAGAYKEMICGRESIKAIKECIEDTDKVCRIFEEIKKLLFVGENVKINISGKMKDCIKTAERFTKIYEGGKCGKDRYFYDVLGNLREKIKIDADVNFNALSADIKDYGYKYDGRMRVLEKIIESDYLWNTVRVKGGAYGGKISVERNGIIQMSSYRDPNYEKTYGYFKATAKYLENFRPNEREFSKFIIGTINNMDRPIKNNRVGDIALYRKFSGIDDEYMKMERKEILECKVEDIRNMSDIFVKIAESDYRCSLSGK